MKFDHTLAQKFVAAGRRKVGKPDLLLLNLSAARSPCLPGVFVERSQLGAVQPSVHSRVCARIDFVQAFRDGMCIQLTSRNPEATGGRFRQTEEFVG